MKRYAHAYSPWIETRTYSPASYKNNKTFSTGLGGQEEKVWPYQLKQIIEILEEATPIFFLACALILILILI